MTAALESVPGRGSVLRAESGRAVIPRPDTTTFLSIFLVLLVAIPSEQRINGLGGAGSPAGLWALGGLLCWALFRLQRKRALLQVGPIARAFAWSLLLATLGSWVQAMMRPLPPLESSQADLGLIRMAAFVGLILLAADGITDLTRLLTTLRRFVIAGAALAALGLFQFFTGRAIVDMISLPAMSSAQSFGAVVARGDFTRSAGTAMSPLEYAFVLVLVFPLALTFAFFDAERGRLVRSLPALIIGAALLVSVSRSGLIGLLFVIVVLTPTWPSAVRTLMLRAGMVALVAVYFLVPGMVGTMRYLFTASDNDPSAQSRAGGLAVVHQFLPDLPFLGRGFGTFLPQYRIFDDAYLAMVIEIGFLGVLAFLGLLLGSAITCQLTARKLRRAGETGAGDLVAQLGYGLAAGVIAAAALTALFDMFAFPMAVGALSLALGLCGAYRRLTTPRRSLPVVSP